MAVYYYFVVHSGDETNTYLFLSSFTSSPVSLLAASTNSVFVFVVFPSSPIKLTSLTFTRSYCFSIQLQSYLVFFDLPSGIRTVNQS